MSRTYKDMPYNVRVARASKGKAGIEKWKLFSTTNHMANNYEYMVSRNVMRLAYPGWDKVSMEEDMNLLRAMYNANNANDGHTVEFRHRVRRAHDFFKESHVGYSWTSSRVPPFINNTMSQDIAELEDSNDIEDFTDILHGTMFHPYVSTYPSIFLYKKENNKDFPPSLTNCNTVLELEVTIPSIRRYDEKDVVHSYLWHDCSCSFCTFDKDKVEHFDSHELVNFVNTNNGTTNMGHREEERYYENSHENEYFYWLEEQALDFVDDDEHWRSDIKALTESKNNNVSYVATFES